MREHTVSDSSPLNSVATIAAFHFAACVLVCLIIAIYAGARLAFLAFVGWYFGAVVFGLAAHYFGWVLR
jgi:hypothetical protein